MYGYPSSHVLSIHARILADDHPHKAGDIEGTEQALLDQLAEAIHSSLGAGSASGGASAGSVLNAMALETQRGIRAELDRLRGEEGLLPADPRVSDADRLRELIEYMARRDQLQWGHREGIVYQEMLDWISRIRETLDPPKMTALRGKACPKCNCSHVREQDDIGEWTYAPSLQVNLSMKPPVAVCRVCLSTWAGGELLDLGALAWDR